MADDNTRHLAVVTGASSGIGLELARQFVEHDFDLIVAADEAAILDAATELRASGAAVETVRADLATKDGVDCLVEQIVADGRPLAAIAINAGVGVSGAFVETDLQDHVDLIGLNVTGAVRLAREVLPAMVSNGEGRVLFTSSVASVMPGPYMSTYNASKSFLQSFSLALREELKDSGVTVTALMPGPTDTEFFERAGMEDTKLGQAKKDDAADVARDGFEAMMAGKDHVVAGSNKNKAQVAAAKVLPDKAVATTHAKLSEPGSGE